MLSQFLTHLKRSEIIEEGTRVLVAYSGGADSTCMLHLMKLAGIDVLAGHLHHGQRAEGDKELALCEAFCKELDIPFASGHASVPTMASELKIGIEEAGRIARYNFLERVAKQFECSLIATAHTKTEHVETVIFNLVRGSGMSGLAGIPERRDKIIRPLLPFTREETRQYCVENGLWFHDDPCNDEVEFSRARIRHRVVPELLQINRGFESAIARTASLLDEEDQFLNGAAAAALEMAEIPLNGVLKFLTEDAEVAFDRSRLESLPVVLFRRAVRLAVSAVGGNLNYEQTATIVQSFQSSETGSVTAEFGQVVAEWDTNKLHIRQLTPTEPFRFKLTLPGETESEQFGWRLTAFEGPNSHRGNNRQAFEVELDIKKVSGELYFRSAQLNDVIQPLGFEGTRKLSDILSEAKLTKAARARLPIICDFLGPIWAPGVCLSHRISKEIGNERVLVLKFEPTMTSNA